MPHLSSAGIRVMVMARDQVSQREGRVFLCNVSDFVMNVIRMAGMQKIFQIEADTGTVLSIIHGLCQEKENDPDIVQCSLNGGSITIRTVCTEKASLLVTGSLSRVLFAQVSQDKMVKIRFSDCEYSIGIGDLAEHAEQARELLGEMITLQGSIIWLPTDGNRTPDFFIPITDTGEVVIYTGFHAALRGHFQDFLTLVTDTPDGISLRQIYAKIFDHARKMRPDYSGIIAVACIGESGDIKRSDLIRFLVPEKTPENGGSIMDLGNVNEWIEVSDTFAYSGEIVAVFGIGIDLTHDLSGFALEHLSALTCMHPANGGQPEMSLHTHGVIFRHAPLPTGEDIGSLIRHLLNTREFLDMCHLTDDSRFRTVRGAVVYISEIVINE